jgi:uncharacterized phage protein (TIGR01671 family)
MREIRFRMWRDGEYQKQMLSGFEDINWEIAQMQLNGAIFEQYTGLKDNNGKEIYEGDILRYSHFYIGDNRYPEGIDTCTFNNGCFMGGEGELSAEEIFNKDIEVIGNIHENPELMK